MQFKLVPHLFAVALVSYLPTGQKSPVNGPSDLRVELRSASGSNSFKVGDPIQLEVVFSSKARGKYLEPCGLMFTHNFGLPLCRYYTKESASIKPDGGWTEAVRSETFGGPFLEVPNDDLSSTPVSHSFLLTEYYCFERPGEYHVTLTVTVGLDDKSTQRPTGANPAAHPHFVTVTPEIVLQIMPNPDQRAVPAAERVTRVVRPK